VSDPANLKISFSNPTENILSRSIAIASAIENSSSTVIILPPVRIKSTFPIVLLHQQFVII
jgi:hypothetical protein